MSTGKRPLFLIPTSDKIEEELADELIANLRAIGRFSSDTCTFGSDELEPLG
jgi:hypothetical protein